MHLNSENITRFAPSPTGHLHLGHILSMAFVYGIAEKQNAKVLLRIEDHDKERCKEEYVESILKDIEWLGLLPNNWDDIQTKGKEHLYRQSFRTERYKKALAELNLTGETYHCHCSRAEILSRTNALSSKNEELYYDGLCRTENFQSGLVRMVMPSKELVFMDGIQGKCIQNPSMQCGDMLLVDRMQNYTYNFAVVVDDIYDKINVIIRGVDLLSCTARQNYLRDKLGSVEVPLFFHHPLILDSQGQKLSKRLKSTGIASLREAGMKPAEVLGLAFHQAGIIESIQPIDKSKLSPLCQVALP
ncbi:MAG: glutamate--tRNA ligase family protein [Parachlamydiales bacterium]|jgi:glutamyl-tRNA synthetase/glutamyl-Q tRNA(Asp) synthetase